MKDILKRYRKQGFTLTMYDTHARDSRGQTKIGYRLSDRGKLIFQGEDFAGSPMHADDSLDTVASLLSFLCLRPGDTDSEYFDAYTPDQLEWCQSARAEELSMIRYELEEQETE
jgi:hypothetical protein